MKTTFSLNNFRVFDKAEGGVVNIAPITILTGCNSSGKSSVVKALILLRDFLSQLKDKPISECVLDFGNKQTKLGRYDSCVNEKSRKNSKMTFSYTVRPKDLYCDLTVILTFGSRKDAILNNGYLEHISIKKKDDVIFDASIDSNGAIKCNKIWLERFILQFFLGKIPELAAYYSEQETETSTERILERLITTIKYIEYVEGVNCWDKIVARKNSIHGGYQAGVYHFEDKYFYEQQIKSIDYTLNQNIFCSFPVLEWVNGVSKFEMLDIVMSKVREAEDSKGISLGEKYKEFIKNFFEYLCASKFEDLSHYCAEMESQLLALDNPQYVDKEYWGFETARTLNDIMGFMRSQHKFSHKAPVTDISNSSFQQIIQSWVDICKFILPKSEFKSYWSEEWTSDYSQVNVELQILKELKQFYFNIIKETLTCQDIQELQYIGDSTMQVERLYSSSRSTDGFGKLLFDYTQRCLSNHWGDFTPGEFINKWLPKFGIGERLEIKQTGDGEGVVMRVYKDSKDKTGRIMADMGFGITKLVGLLIFTEYCFIGTPIGNRPKTGSIFKGLKPQLKTTSDVEDKSYPYITIAIEEPENHLHPRYQSLLADMLVEANKEYGAHFIVETHSEYMIRKLQTLVAEDKISTDDISLVYMYDADPLKRPKKEPQVKHLGINNDGTLKTPFGSGFFDEADKLAMDLLTISVK